MIIPMPAMGAMCGPRMIHRLPPASTHLQGRPAIGLRPVQARRLRSHSLLGLRSLCALRRRPWVKFVLLLQSPILRSRAPALALQVAALDSQRSTLCGSNSARLRSAQDRQLLSSHQKLSKGSVFGHHGCILNGLLLDSFACMGNLGCCWCFRPS